MKDLEAIEILKEFGEYFKQMNIIWLVLYPLMWSLLIDGFYDIAIRMEGLLDSVLTFGGVMQSEGMQTLYTYLTPIAFAFLAIAVIGVAFQLISGKAVQKTNILLNLVLAVSVIMLLPWFVMKLGELSDDIIEVSKSAGVEDNIEVSSLSTQIVQTNTGDVVYLARNDFTEADDNINNTITDGNIRDIDFSEIVHPSPDEDNGERDFGESASGENINEMDVFSNKIVDAEDGTQTTKEIEPYELKFIGEIPFLNEYYYRYSGNFLNMFAQLGILIAVMLFTSFKVIRLFFEIAFVNIIAPFVATTDLSTGQRTKQLLKDLVINFAVVGLVMLVFKIFMVMMNYLSTLDLNAIVVTVIMFALGLATIDGPDQAKKLLGIDIGVKDGYRQLMAGLAVGSVATKASGGVRKHLGNEKDKFLQQHQDKKDAKEGASNALSNKNESGAYSIDSDLNNALSNKGYTNSKDNEEISDTNKTNKGMSEESQLASNLNAKDSGQNEDGARNVIENLVQDQNKNINDEERNVLEKVMNDNGATLNTDERQVLENLVQNDALGTQEKQALMNTLDTDNATNAVDSKDVISNMVQNGDSNLSNDERETLEKLIHDPSNVSAEERQVLENLMQNDSIGSQERQAVESLISSGDSSQSDQSRNVLENLISNENSNVSNEEKQVLENLVQNPSNVSAEERQVLENLMQNDSIGSQERQAVESLISSGDNSMGTQERQAVESFVGSAEASSTQGTKNVLENVISNDSGAVSQAERQVLERFVENPSSLSPTERSVVENVSSNGSIEPQQRQAMEQVLTENPTSEPASRQVVQTLSNEGSMTVPDIQQNVVRMMNDGAIKSQEADAVINTLQAPSASTSQQREVIENIITNRQDLGSMDRQTIENVVTQSANIGTQERQVLEKVMQAPQEVSQSERQVIENVISNDNNLTARERTSIENVISNHVPQNDTNQNVYRSVVENDNTSSHKAKTEDIVKNMTTNFKADTSSIDDVKRKHEQINRMKKIK